MIKSLSDRLSIFKSPWFIFGLFIKLAFMILSDSKIIEKLFIPFIDYAVVNNEMNPWTAFTPEHFPYGYFPFLVLFIPKFISYALFGDAALGLTALSYLTFKLPLLFFDAAILWVFSRWSVVGIKKLLLFYWLNPILLYITYVYGQLDIISISLLIFSIFLILKNKTFWSALFFGLAISSKFHVIILLPFLMAYFWRNNFRKEALQKIFIFFVSSLAIASALFLPNFFAGQFQFAVGGSPEVLRLLSLKIVFENNLSIYLGIIFVLLTLGRLVFSTRITESGLIYGSALILGVLLLATNPRPGWFFWIVPFLCLFFSQYSSSAILLMFASWAFYLLHFVVFDQFANEHLRSLSLTILQGGLLAQLVVLYSMCVNNEASIRYRVKPLFLGISGDSGAGKNYFTEIIQKLLNDKSVLIVEGDNYHRWERGNINWSQMTHLNPMANQLFELIAHTKKFSQGQSILHHHYDHNTGRFTAPQIITPKKTVIIQGLHSLYLKSLRDHFDLKIFLNPSEDIRTYWKLRRDVFERGHSKDSVIKSMQNRKNDSDAHVKPQIVKSDWVVEYIAGSQMDPLQMTDQVQSLALKYIVNSDESIQALLENLKSEGQQVEIHFLEDIDKVSIYFKNQLSKEQIIRVSEKTFSNLRVLTRSSNSPDFCAGFDGLHQLFLLLFLQKRLG